MRTTRVAVTALLVAACSSSSEGSETPDAATDAATAPEAGPSDAGVSDGGSAEAGASACTDDDGFIPSCAAINGLAERQCDRATCERYVKRMKTRLSRLAIQCMTRHISAGDSCRPCSAEALANACPDGNAAMFCDSLVKSCPARKVEECTPILSGLSFGGRLNFATCATDDNCFHDFASCLP